MTMTPSLLSDSTKLFEFKPGKKISVAALKKLLPTVQVALFFGKVYHLNYQQLSELLWLVHRTGVVEALLEGNHSVDLQDYIVDCVPPDLIPEDHPVFTVSPPPAEVLPEVWESLEVVIAKSIAEVADKLTGVIGMLPGKQGEMVFSHLAKLNRQRPTIGSYQAGIHHASQVPNLVVFDVSGSMTERTVRTIVDDVVALSWKANAHLAIVSNTAYHWEPGAYDSAMVLQKAEFGGTQYEQLTPLFNQNWGTVVTIADYDSSRGAKEWIRDNAQGSIDTVLDISLVNRPTFLSECLGQLAREVRPILIGNDPYYVLS